jgi:hypothetical protein
MELKDHQLRVFNKLIKHDKSFVFCPRQWGKTYVLTKYLEYFIQNNRGENILLIGEQKGYLKNILAKILREIGNLTIDKHRTEIGLYFINGNYLEICEIKKLNMSLLGMLNPKLILYDEIFLDDLNDLHLLAFYIKMSKCKCIFNTTKLNIDIVKLLDCNNDYYIKIIPINLFDNLNKENNLLLDHKKIIKAFSYKPPELFDFDDMVYQRRIKLNKLKEISDGK